MNTSQVCSLLSTPPILQRTSDDQGKDRQTTNTASLQSSSSLLRTVPLPSVASTRKIQTTTLNHDEPEGEKTRSPGMFHQPSHRATKEKQLFSTTTTSSSGQAAANQTRPWLSGARTSRRQSYPAPKSLGPSSSAHGTKTCNNTTNNNHSNNNGDDHNIYFESRNSSTSPLLSHHWRPQWWLAGKHNWTSKSATPINRSSPANADDYNDHDGYCSIVSSPKPEQPCTGSPLTTTLKSLSKRNILTVGGDTISHPPESPSLTARSKQDSGLTDDENDKKNTNKSSNDDDKSSNAASTPFCGLKHQFLTSPTTVATESTSGSQRQEGRKRTGTGPSMFRLITGSLEKPTRDSRGRSSSKASQRSFPVIPRIERDAGTTVVNDENRSEDTSFSFTSWSLRSAPAAPTRTTTSLSSLLDTPSKATSGAACSAGTIKTTATSIATSSRSRLFALFHKDTLTKMPPLTPTTSDESSVSTSPHQDVPFTSAGGEQNAILISHDSQDESGGENETVEFEWKDADVDLPPPPLHLPKSISITSSVQNENDQNTEGNEEAFEEDDFSYFLGREHYCATSLPVPAEEEFCDVPSVSTSHNRSKQDSKKTTKKKKRKKKEKKGDSKKRSAGGAKSGSLVNRSAQGDAAEAEDNEGLNCDTLTTTTSALTTLPSVVKQFNLFAVVSEDAKHDGSSETETPRLRYASAASFHQFPLQGCTSNDDDDASMADHDAQDKDEQEGFVAALVSKERPKLSKKKSSSLSDLMLASSSLSASSPRAIAPTERHWPSMMVELPNSSGARRDSRPNKPIHQKCFDKNASICGRGDSANSATVQLKLPKQDKEDQSHHKSRSSSDSRRRNSRRRNSIDNSGFGAVYQHEQPHLSSMVMMMNPQSSCVGGCSEDAFQQPFTEAQQEQQQHKHSRHSARSKVKASPSPEQSERQPPPMSRSPSPPAVVSSSRKSEELKRRHSSVPSSFREERRVHPQTTRRNSLGQSCLTPSKVIHWNSLGANTTSSDPNQQERDFTPSPLTSTSMHESRQRERNAKSPRRLDGHGTTEAADNLVLIQRCKNREAADLSQGHHRPAACNLKWQRDRLDATNPKPYPRSIEPMKRRSSMGDVPPRLISPIGRSSPFGDAEEVASTPGPHHQSLYFLPHVRNINTVSTGDQCDWQIVRRSSFSMSPVVMRVCEASPSEKSTGPKTPCRRRRNSLGGQVSGNESICEASQSQKPNGSSRGAEYPPVIKNLRNVSSGRRKERPRT